MRSASTPSPARLHRRVAWLWLALSLYVAGYLGGAWHDASERHSFCEHGEAVHASATSAPAPHSTCLPGAPGAPVALGAPVSSVAGADECLSELRPGLAAPLGMADAHEHCLAWSPAKRPAGEARLALPPAPPRAAVVAPDLERTKLPAAFPLFLLAPGRSPPTA